MTYQQSAHIYDAIYSFKDYAGEAERIAQVVVQYAGRPCKTLLDAATGTGAHLVHLQDHFAVDGLDLSVEMLSSVRERLPDVRCHEANMGNFDLGKTFDVVTCLFSSIGYLLTEDLLRQAVGTFAKHLNPGGVLLIEPWVTPDVYRAGTIHATFVDQPDPKNSRMTRSDREGDIAVM